MNQKKSSGILKAVCSCVQKLTYSQHKGSYLNRDVLLWERIAINEHGGSGAQRVVQTGLEETETCV